MSFFGFDPTVPRDRPHNTKAPGFAQAPDPFAGLSAQIAEDDDALDFEDTYDGLGTALEEDRDDFNDDTFGIGNVDTNFDFSGQRTSQASQQPQRPQHQQQPQQQQQRAIPLATQLAILNLNNTSPKPARTGYESYGTQPIPKLQANPSIWGAPEQSRQTPQHLQQPSLSTVSRKMMSLEEVEAAMRAQQKPSPAPAQQYIQPPPQEQPIYQQTQQQNPQPQYRQPTSTQQMPFPSGPMHQQIDIAQLTQPNQYNQSPLGAQNTFDASRAPPTARQILPFAPNEPSTAQQNASRHGPVHNRGHSRGQSFNGQIITHPQQIMQLSDQDRDAFIAEDAKRAKRNHKIHLLSKDNGIMTPQDKNFITRIQLQQLVTATGGVDETGPEAALAEDFYYQVYCQIRGGPRSDSNQPLNHFAQTYLHQTAWRTGNRRYPRGGENHMRRMDQQVQRAVEAVRNKPKNKQLVMQGSLGKISFSNAKTPKPLLNIKRQEIHETKAERTSVLRDIERLYSTLMKMEDHERRMPPPPTEESSGDEIQRHIEWRSRIKELNDSIWKGLKVLEPIMPNASTPHPFIAILSHPKGKKLIPRVFRQIDDQQRLTILTMIVVHLDILDVIRQAQPQAGETQLPKAIRDEVELFSQAVMPSLFTYVNDVPLGVITGLIGLVVARVNLQALIRTRIGVALLTMFMSRAELIKQGGHADGADLQQLSEIYNRLFDLLEPELINMFPETLLASEEMYVWQFLAAIGVGASPEQQQRLVIAVKDKVMGTVTQAKALPDDEGRPRLDNVNLFMHAIGLDVELLG